MFKAAAVFLIITAIFSALYAIFTIAAPQIIAGSTLEARSGKTFDELDEQVAETIVVQIRHHMGVSGLTTTIGWTFAFIAGLITKVGLVGIATHCWNRLVFWPSHASD
jgi:hypothetical protein